MNMDIRSAAIKAAQLALAGHRGVLKSKILATDMAISTLAVMAAKEKRIAKTDTSVQMEKTEKENTDMKSLLKGIVAIAAIGAAVGAGYAYYKKNKSTGEDYEELLYTDDMEGEVEYVEVESKMDKVVHVAEDVKEVVVSAAENVADTVTDAFYDVKEAINNAIED